jgi:hypothetical protein
MLLVPGLALYGAAVFFTVGPGRAQHVDPRVWWGCLSAACAALFLTAWCKPCKSAVARRCACLVCACYLHRAAFMHCTVERDCFWDLTLCTSLWGRTVACTGEMTFVYLASSQIAPGRVQRIVVALIAVAQTLSFVGVIKKHYLWFFFENGLWTVCAAGLALHLFLRNTRACFQSVPYMLGLFVCYNVYEDLPMYLARHAEKTHLPEYNLGLYDGVLDSLECTRVSQASEVWAPQMLWQTLNYTIVPAACIGLMSCAEGDGGMGGEKENKIK